ncbi:toll/interleukin-1 receptor domain-containing protein [bacterium]|nr:toll/interleukin-1 receptor domain-containing protein [bacterium]
MVKPKHFEILKLGVEFWNKWREDNPGIQPELRGVNLEDANLGGVNLRYANLWGAYLGNVNLERANLFNANLQDANLRGANLMYANLEGASLVKTNLVEANLWSANLRGANLFGAYLPGARLARVELKDSDFRQALLNETIFADVDLSNAINLDLCFHVGPSVIDFRTLQKSGPLPRKFLRGVGLPEVYIDYLPSLFDTSPFQFHTCFISYYHEDQEFAERLHADLLDKGVRVWLYTHDMPIGGRMRKVIDVEIRDRDKVILVLSEKTVQSNWVEYEVDKTLDEEVRRKADILMPVRLDDSVFECEDNWATRLTSRSIGDFTKWKEHDEYLKSFEFLMKWLKSEQKPEKEE